MDRETLWKIIWHYDVPKKLVFVLICNTYQGMKCRITHTGHMSNSFEVKTGSRQGYLKSPFRFLLVIDWILRTIASGGMNEIKWILLPQLDDLDFDDDLVLLSYNHNQMQKKTTRLATTSTSIGLKINLNKTINTTAQVPVTDEDKCTKERVLCLPWEGGVQTGWYRL